jgi:hypothetical protein
MLVKQIEQERVAALQKLHQSLKPAVLLDGDNEKSTPDALAKIEANSNLIKGYLQKNFTDARGVTDFTFDNLRAAVLALVDDLYWSVPPKNFGAKERVSKRNAANALGLGSHKTEFDRPELNKPQTSIYDQHKQDVEKLVATKRWPKQRTSSTGITEERIRERTPNAVCFALNEIVFWQPRQTPRPLRPRLRKRHERFGPRPGGVENVQTNDEPVPSRRSCGQILTSDGTLVTRRRRNRSSKRPRN